MSDQQPTTPPPATPASPAPAQPSPAAEPAVPTIQYDDFAKVQLRVATVLSAEPVEKSKKLLKLQVDLGNEQRQILAGIKEHYAPEEMVGKQIVVVCNLAPREVIKGQVSNGMLLAASDPATGKVIVISPSAGVGAGAGVR
jgi:methionyl-tRNA synthetase